MALKGAVRRRQVFKTQCLAERCHGDSQEACIALRGRNTLAYLAYDASQSILKPNSCLGSKVRPMARTPCGSRHRRTCLPCAGTGEPKRADGVASNTPPTSSCLSPPG